jgi:hypothetical protein
VEDYLEKIQAQGRETFTPYEMQDGMNIDGPDASIAIQAYLREQRKRPRVLKSGGTTGGSRAKFVLHRDPGTRTSAALWRISVNTQEARNIGSAMGDDVKHRLVAAIVPELQRMSALNPRLARLTRRQIEAAVDYALPLFEMALQGMTLPQADEQPS